MATKYSSHNAGGGGAGTQGDPYTLQELADAIDGSTNALGLVMATGTYTPSVTIDFDTNIGTTLAPVIIRGAASNGDDDGTIATISGSSLGAGDDLIDLGINANVIEFHGLRVTAATRYNIYCDTTARVIFKNCRIDNANNDGLYNLSSIAILMFIETEVDSNGADGLRGDASGRGGFLLLRCSVHDNIGNGIRDGATIIAGKYPSYISNLVYDNGIDGLQIMNIAANDYTRLILQGNVFFGNTGDGLDLDTDLGRLIIENNIFRSNGGYGINTNTGDLDAFLSCKNNCSHNNTSGHIDINAGVLPGTGHIYQDPLFTSETDGSEDFEPQEGSPLLGARIDGGIW